MVCLLPHRGLALFTLFATACGGERTERFSITGSSTVAPILQKVAETLDAEGSELVLEVQTGGSTRGIQDARLGLVDMGMASRSLTAEEGVGLTVVTIARDGVAMITHASNPLEDLGAEEVRRIYRGEVRDWAAIGGASGPITVVNKAEGRATLEVFLAHFGLENREITARVVVGDNAQAVRTVAGNPGAIGYVSIGEALLARENGQPIKLLALDGVEPSQVSVASGEFALQRSLTILFPGEPDERGKQLLQFLASPRGRAIIEDFRFIPVLDT